MQRLLDLLRPGVSVYLPGATGECLALTHALAAAPERTAGVNIISCLLPGFNSFDYPALHPEARLTCFMLPPLLRGSFQRGQIDLLPLSYSGIARYLGERVYDIAVAHVAAPDAAGRCSLGIAADFTPIAWPRARCKVLMINPAMPALAQSPSLAPHDADLVIEIEPCPLITAKSRASGETEARIAAHVAALVPEGAAVQVGIGGAPSAALPLLKDHRGLVIASGFVGPEFEALWEAGAFAPDAAHQTGVALGESGFYDWLKRTPKLRFASVRETHDVAALGARPRFTAINSALEIDLFGQVNLEWRGQDLMGGVGGAPEFGAAAQRSAGGRSIIALPSMAGGDSRIVAGLSGRTVSLPRTLIDTIVTEHGVAELRGKSLDARAEALIQIAAPTARAQLENAWRALRTRVT